MIPLVIHIKNFLSYGDTLQTIDFGPYPLICLSGKNGHGKSALLDAITWAIWGQARKIVGFTKSDHTLIRLGQTHMMVILDFELNNTMYRIRREYTHHATKAQAYLEFGIIRADKTTIIPLTDKTIRLTQEKIDKTLRLDFDTFVNSAFLRQGNSNEFSKKSAAERKEILTTILGLSHYESVRKKALEKIKTLNLERQLLITMSEQTEKIVEKKQQLSEQLTYVTLQLKTLQEQYQYNSTQEQSLHIAIKLLHTIEERTHQHHARIVLINKKKLELSSSLQEAVATWRREQRTFQIIHNTDDLLQQRINLMHELKTHQTLLQQSLLIQEQKLAIAIEKQQLITTISQQHSAELQKISHEHDRALNSQNLAKKNLAHLMARKDNSNAMIIALTKELDTLQKQIACNETAQQTLNAQTKTFEKRKEYYHTYLAQANNITTLLKEEQARSLLTNDTVNLCPLCDQKISEDQQTRMRIQNKKQASFLSHRLTRYTKLITALKGALVEQHALLSSAQQQQEQLTTLKTQYHERSKQHQLLCTEQTQGTLAVQEAEKELLRSNHIATTLATEKEKMAAQGATQIENNPLYQSIIAKEAALIEQHAALQCSNTALALIQQQLTMVEEKLHAHTAAQKNILLQKERRTTIKTLCQSIREMKQELRDHQFYVDEYMLITPLKNLYCQTLQDLQSVMQSDQVTKEECLQVIGRLQEAYTYTIEQEKKYQEQVKQRTTIENDLSDYQVIATALSKDGIPALLIEQIIPDIEYETNRLLKKLTNNQSHVIIESLRDLKNGSAKETLDIKISDNAGIRPYELFSGGEAFRIDFALRIALAKLLARRSGTTLQTLIIDEGFGSQDDDGLSAIMDAIYKIQDDFAKIIIVSHLPTMKDQFPVHFMVHKGPHGSTITLMEQG